ncbi:YggT family protein [Lampropedia aestuarii]|uniref:YggT family protein n=1 Tax=Lampropedia aestuarii TaxID=2562762 RepID=UPI00246859D1|nr:YggT family protein [Lampropedia aestuarii]MDH5857070.1 YggT family protein [Lampropedia aestuarii]
MFYEIFAFLIGTAAQFLATALLLRCVLQAMRINFSNPLGQLVLTTTNWLVRPVRKLVQATGRWDWVCVLLAYLIVALQLVLLIGVAGQLQLMPLVPIRAAFELLSIAIWLAIGLLLLMTALSWLMPGHWLYAIADRLCQPLLGPIRRRLPGTASGIDFSPMVLSLLLYIALIVVRRVELNLLSWMLM